MDEPRLTSEPESREGEGARVEELLRVNAELAAELRALLGERAEAPRTGRVPAARGIARLEAEREALQTRLQETQAALEHLQGVQVALDVVSAERERLGRENENLAAEVARLRAGWRGILRRLRARLLGRG